MKYPVEVPIAAEAGGGVAPPNVRDDLSRLDLAAKLTGDFGQPLEMLDWWREALARLDDPDCHALMLNVPRQAGKTQLLAVMAVSELVLVPGSFTILISASEAQAQSIFARKIRRPAERLLAALGLDRRRMSLTKRGLELLDLGSALEVIATSEISAPGRSPSLVLFDECRDIEDGVFETLIPSAIGAGATLVLASTAGRLSGFFYSLVTTPPEGAWVYRSAENENPRAHRAMVAFLRKTFGYLSPAAAARELRNEFADDADAFLPAALIDEAIDDTLGEVPVSAKPAYGFLDLSRRHDLTSLVIVIRDAPRRLEVSDHLVVASVQMWNPKDSPTGEVPFNEVREALLRVTRRFPGLETLLVDEGAEAGSVMPWARARPELTLRIQGFMASPTSNAAVWGALAARLHEQTVSLPRHARLINELKSLRQESFRLGGWRVVDSSKRWHRDVSLSLAGAIWAATGPSRQCVQEWCRDPECSGLHLLGADHTPADEAEREEAALWAAGTMPGTGRPRREAADAAAAWLRDKVTENHGWFPGD